MNDEQPATLRILAGIGGLGERGVSGIPMLKESVTALLKPSVEIGGSNLVGPS